MQNVLVADDQNDLLYDFLLDKNLSFNIRNINEGTDHFFANLLYKIALIYCEGANQESIEYLMRTVNIRLETVGIPNIIPCHS